MAVQVGVTLGQLVLGPVLTDISKGIKKLVKTTWQFRDFAEGIKLDFERVLPLIQELEGRNTELNISNENLYSFRKKMEEGLKLAHKCSKVCRWELYKRYRYTTRLEKLGTYLNTWLDGLTFEKVRDGKVLLIMLKKNDQSWVKRIKDWVQSICSTVAAWVKRLLSIIF